jgi:hypothetical protein
LKRVKHGEALGTGADRYAAPPPENTIEYFQADCRGLGGGGLIEKVKRFRGLRQRAAELVGEVDKMTNEQAMNSLVEAAFDAPFERGSKKAAKKIMRERKWNVAAERFPEVVAAAAAAAPVDYPDVRRPAANAGLLPTFEAKGKNSVSLDDEEVPVIQFRHRRANGEINEHENTMIGIPSLIAYLDSSIKERGTSSHFGKCWNYPECDATLYPEEIEPFVGEGEDKVPRALFDAYRRAFNEAYAAGRGGGRGRSRGTRRQRGAGRRRSRRAAKAAKAPKAAKKELPSFLGPATDAACYLPKR